MEFVNRYIPWAAWPLGMTAAIVAFFAFQMAGMSMQLSTYAAVVFGAAIVTAFEIWIPARAAWKPSGIRISVS